MDIFAIDDVFEDEFVERGALSLHRDMNITIMGAKHVPIRRHNRNGVVKRSDPFEKVFVGAEMVRTARVSVPMMPG